MNTGVSSVLGWTVFTAATLTGLYFARVELNERRAQQAERGVRKQEKLSFEDRINGTPESSSPAATDNSKKKS
eukprot:m.191214 g.191214  ORF g.191214 m.191214 type:complete len:73 (-) comp21721_c0_seq7:65-283(-)